MQIHAGFEFVMESGSPTPIVSIVRPRAEVHPILDERRSLSPGVPVREYLDDFGNLVWRWTAPEGLMRIEYHVLVEVPDQPDLHFPHLVGTPVDQLPDDLLVYTLPSRYCPSDLALNEAWELFGGVPDGYARVQAICDWIHENVTYGPCSTSSTTGYESLQERSGVCRDFAHIAIMFCRALNIPARYVCGYLPEIGVPPDPAPMDFHAWFEAYLGGAWQTFDARHNIPRIGRVVVARGRDAVDTAFLTTYGHSTLNTIRVWAAEGTRIRTLEEMDAP